MNPRIIIRPKAKAEIRHAYTTYRSISSRLGERFRDAVRERIRRISENPRTYPLVHGDIRRAITTDFPYSLFYAIESEGIIILRVVHHAQDPAEWPTGT